MADQASHPFGEPRRSFADKATLVRDATIFDVTGIEQIDGYRGEGKAWAVTIQTRDGRTLTLSFPENEERDAVMEASIAYIKEHGKVPNCSLSSGKKSGAFFINHAHVG